MKLLRVTSTDVPGISELTGYTAGPKVYKLLIQGIVNNTADVWREHIVFMLTKFLQIQGTTSHRPSSEFGLCASQKNFGPTKGELQPYTRLHKPVTQLQGKLWLTCILAFSLHNAYLPHGLVWMCYAHDLLFGASPNLPPLKLCYSIVIQTDCKHQKQGLISSYALILD